MVLIFVILVGFILVCFLFDVVFDLMGKGEENWLKWVYIFLFVSFVMNFCVIVWCN